MTLLSQNERRIWTRQPQKRVKINWGHPLARGLVGAWVPTFGAGNLAGTSSLFVQNNLTAGPDGVRGQFSGKIGTDAQLRTPSFGVATAFYTGTADVYSVVVGRGVVDTEEFGFHATHSNPTYAGALYCGSSYSVIGKPTGGALSNNTRYAIGGGASGGNGSVYSNGVLTATASGLGTPDVSGDLWLGRSNATLSTWTVSPSFEYLYVWDRLPSPEEFKEIARNPWQLFAPRRTRRYISLGAGGGARTLTTSLAAAIQAAQFATASMSAGVQAARTNTATTDAAVLAAQSAQASLNAAVSNITQAVASLGGAVLNSGATSASANAAVQLARNATASLNLAVQAQGNATASVSAQVQAGSSLSAALDGYVQAGSSISASASAAVLASALAQAGIAAAVQTPTTTPAGLSAALRAAQQATAAIDAALQLARNATAGLSAQVQSGTSASVAIDAAIRTTAQALAGVDAAIARAGSASLSMGAAVALQRSISAAMAGALLSSRLSAVSANAYVFDPLSLIRVYASWQRSGRQEQLTATSRAGQVTSSRRPPQ